MKKIILSFCIFFLSVIAAAQTCPDIQGFSPIPVRFGINVYGNPESAFPLIPLYWNRFYTVDVSTGQLTPVTCAYTGDPNISEFAYCACFLTGTYFRKVSDVCDLTPCGGDLTLPQLPITNNNNPSSNWAQAATWMANQVPDVSSSLSVMLSKSTQIDLDLNFPQGRWLILSAGNSSILSGKTVTCNSMMHVYPGAQLENFGTLKGTGKIFGSFINSGTLSPGNSPGKFSIIGNYVANSTAVQEIEIASANLYDTINIEKDVSFPGGNAVLNGTLNVDLLNGFLPSLGESYKIITFTSATGSFTDINLPALPIGLSWDINYNPTDISLKVIASTVPLTIKYAKAYKHNNGVLVEWGTENELNVKNYEVQKSIGGTHFSKIGKVNATGTNSNHYDWFDASPAKANNYYRIKEIDIDGKFTYSPIMLIRIIDDNAISVYPNPVKRNQVLQINLQNVSASKIEVININGQVLYSKAERLTGNVSIPISHSWPAGEYVLKVITENKVETKKILLE